jgi:hypothetical protein
MAEKEFIEREALLKDISESVVFSVKEGQPSLEIRGANKITDRIKAAPAADVVEVVRCKDCKYNKKADGNDGIIICNIDGETDEETGIDYGFVTYCSENHFCSYGERREEDA